MQALILAAGRGSRLGGKTTQVPKCLLEVGRRPMIEHQLEVLAEAGVGPVGMVLGYCADEIREVVGIRADYILNPRWNATNSLCSFLTARDWVKGPVVVLNCDILFDPEILERLLAVKGDAIAYDSSSGAGREHMKVKVHNGRLLTMSKELGPQDNAGENVGILRLTAETAEAMFQKADALVAAEGEKLWVGSAVCEIAREHDVRAVDVAGLPWGEIDFPYDLDRVRKEVWPAICQASRARRQHWRLARRLAAALPILLVIVLLARGWVTPPPPAWESVDVDDGKRVKIRAGDRTQSWLLITADQSAEMEVTGPTPVRIDSRILLPSNTTETTPYVLEIELDGERFDWFKETGKPSNTWRHPQWKLAKRVRIQLNVPPGPHTMRVRLIASESGSCLIRIRQEITDETEE